MLQTMRKVVQILGYAHTTTFLPLELGGHKGFNEMGGGHTCPQGSMLPSLVSGLISKTSA